MITTTTDVTRVTSVLAAGEPRRARITMPIWRPRPEAAASSAAAFAAASFATSSGLLVIYDSTPGNQAGDECRVAPGQMPRGGLCARALVKLFGQVPIFGGVPAHCLEV